jgi:hypothetical protein
MIRAFFDLLPVLAVCVLLGLWIAHILRMWSSLFTSDE